MQVQYNGRNEKIINCVEFINDLLEFGPFYEEIAKHPNFTHLDDSYSPKKISEILKADQIYGIGQNL